ncbi:MAG: ATP-binding protein [Actinomycetota bacterium]|nr:ATP-binding protein [Actinomycetota bacterium]
MMDPDLLPDAVFGIDVDRCLVTVNAAAAALVGHSREAMLGQSIDDLLHPRSAGDGTAPIRGWHPSAHLPSVVRIPENEVWVRGANGDIPVMVTGSYQRDPDGRLTGAVLVARNGLRRPNMVPEGIEVISTVSHEIRSPLTSVRGYTSLLLNRWERLGEEQKRSMLEQVHHDATRVTRLVTELLDISRLESGRLELHRQLIDVEALVDGVLEKVGMAEPDLDVTVAFQPGFPRVYADPDKIEQVLTNLVENAAKYGNPRGMRIEGRAGDREVTVGVSDRGDGIPESDLPRIFTKFFRRSETRPTGTGLGLWISRGLVEAHGGTLDVESEVGRGSTFMFTLPAGLPEELAT